VILNRTLIFLPLIKLSKMKKIFFFVAGCAIIAACNNKAADTTATKTDTSSATASEPKPTPQAEFADQKYTDLGKKMTEQLSNGNVNDWIANFSDNAAYRWSSGDSLIGKAAIQKYWEDRRKNVIDSLTFSNQVWLPIKVNRSQVERADVPGVWLLSWYMVNAKYKNGKKVLMWVHTDFHFDNTDKVDIAIQYIDRAPINKALGVK
jgi:hypothetical protein